MRTVERIIEYRSRSDVVTIKPFFDIHLGSALCDETRLKEDIRQVKDDPLAFWILGGDACELISSKDKRLTRRSQLADWLKDEDEDDIITRQLEEFTKLFGPIKDKCLTAVLGNHEDYMMFTTGQDAYRIMIRALDDVEKVRDSKLALGVQGFLVLRFRRMKKTGGPDTWTQTMYLHHGYGGGRLPGGHALTLGRIFTNHGCDFALLGHRHVVGFVPNDMLSPSARADRTEKRKQAAMFCGTYRDGMPESVDPDYAEMKGLPPVASRQIELRFTPDKKRVSLNIEL